MLELLWLVPVLPLIGSALLAVAGGWCSRRLLAVIGVGSVAGSMAAAGLVGVGFLRSLHSDPSYSQTLWTWMGVSGFAPAIGFYLDALSLVMMMVITVVSLLIHVYSTEFMIDDEGYRRFFAYMNLFVASMLTLVLADNLLLLYLGWEGVGLCSYLLIGFWYRESANGQAAQKAFIVTRVGDAAMAVGLFLLFTQLNTLNIHDLLERATYQWAVGSGLAIAAAALLLGGAVGKSAQIPLQVWLPDAMAGPTPVSALIHAATMVTAGVYLIARMQGLYNLAPSVQTAVAVVGVLTLLSAGCSALVQRDIKRALAYSTISQIGYMFLALGVGAWSGAMFHFMTHAFFKALLFLSAGAVILSLHEEHDIYAMGGLRRELPVCFWTFVIGASSLAGVPLVTAGFYSKDGILLDVWASPLGGPWLWTAGMVGALLTAVYSFRLVFVVFFGERRTAVRSRPGPTMALPLIILAGLSLVAGCVELPKVLGDVHLFNALLRTAQPVPEYDTLSPGMHVALLLVTMAVSLFGIAIAYLLFVRRPDLATVTARTRWGGALSRFWFEGWGFDRLYGTLFVRPFLWVARVDQDDLVDQIYRRLAWFCRLLYAALHRTQTGQVRWYAAVLATGSIAMIALVVFS
jgi:NADH-quinone oxidoreductase subunit L